MFIKGLSRPGDCFAKQTVECFNRTGQTLVKGLVVMMDFALSATETDSTVPGDPGHPTANVVPVTQAGYDNGYPILVCDEATLADNKKGRFVASGLTEIAVLDDDESTTDVDAGDQISMLVSESAYAVQAQAAADHRVIGHAFEAAEASGGSITTPDGADAELKECLFHGGYPNLGYSRDA